MKRMKFKPSLYNLLTLLILILLQLSIYNSFGTQTKPKVRIAPAPVGEELSQVYKIKVLNQQVPVYAVKVNPKDQEKRLKAFNDVRHAADYFDTAAFAYFDVQGTVIVTVTIPGKIASAKILPTSAGIKPVLDQNTLTFSLTKPQNLTIEINGEYVRSLHLFANPIETNIPRKDDPNVIYFGPGIHTVSHLIVGDNKTVYLAPGSIVRAVIDPKEPYTTNSSDGLASYQNSSVFDVKGKNIVFRGRGILDGSACPTHSKNLIMVQGSKQIKLEGIILRDGSIWNIPIRKSDSVEVDNVKILGYRPNSDGIDICNSRNVTITNCFVRSNDDLVVVKTDKGQGAAEKVVVKKCVLWNQLAHALSIGAEISEPVTNIFFNNCDIIHDQGIEWSLRIYQCDAALVSNIRFENIRIEEAHKCISVWIGKANWSRDKEFGHIKNIIFKHIKASGKPLNIELIGIDSQHAVQNITFEDVKFNDKPININIVKTNAFVEKVVIKP